MSFSFRDENGTHPFATGATLKLTIHENMLFHWQLCIEGADRHEGDCYEIDNHGNHFSDVAYVVPKLTGDDPVVFDILSKGEGLPKGNYRFSILRGLLTLCVIEVSALPSQVIEIQSPAEDSGLKKKLAALRNGRADPKPDDGEAVDIHPGRPGPWTNFGVRSLYGVLAMIILFALSCGGFSLWTGGKVVNLFTDWARSDLVEKKDNLPPPTPPTAATPPAKESPSAEDQTKAPALETRPPIEVTPPPDKEEKKKDLPKKK